MDRPLDLLLINPDSSAKAYQGLAQIYSAIEPPTWVLLLAESCRAKGFGVAILDCDAERLTLAQALKAAGNAAPIAFVGSHTSALPLAVLGHDSVDIVLLNEGVYALHNLLLSNLEADFHRCSQADWTFCTFRTRENGRYVGMDIAPGGRVDAFRNERNSGERLANGGVYLLAPALLATAGYFPGHALSLEDQLLPTLLAQGCRFYGTEFPGSFIDIGIPVDYGQAAAILAIRHE